MALLVLVFLTCVLAFIGLKRPGQAKPWLRRVLGTAALLLLAALSPDAAPGGLAGSAQNARIQVPSIPVSAAADDADGRKLPDLSGATAWLNSPSLTKNQLKGKVVLVDFWTYSCINCLRSMPYLRAWAARYKDSGLVVIGVHTPEFGFEEDPANVAKAVRKFDITFPVAIDSQHRIWNAFNNEYWPAHYFIDATGRIRFHHFGEGRYDESETWIRQLLAERNGQPAQPRQGIEASGAGVEAPSDGRSMASPETYIGYERAAHFVSPGGLSRESSRNYAAPRQLELNQWGLAGKWTDRGQDALLDSTPGSILFRFHARDLHLVLGPAANAKPVRFRVRIDGQAPGENHGVDTDAQGYGVVTEDRLYQLVRQQEPIQDHTFEIEFLDPGVHAFSFTFG
jgi:thiol-disulfide isomerase/thioredoxin